MGISYGPRGETLISGRPMWRNLDGTPATDDEAGRLWKDPRRFIERTQIGDNVLVSTIFTVQDRGYMLCLGEDPEALAELPPLLWETKVFGGQFDEQEIPWESLDRARAGHALIVRTVEESEGLAPHPGNALVPVLCLICGEPFRNGEIMLSCVPQEWPLGRPGDCHTECEMLGIVGHQFRVCGCYGFEHNRAAALELWRRIQTGLDEWPTISEQRR